MGTTGHDTTAAPALSRRDVALETAIVVWVAIFPYLLASVGAWGGGEPRQGAFTAAQYLAGLLQVYGPGVALALYLIRRGDEPPARFGLAPPRWPADALLPVFLFVAQYLWCGAIAWGLHALVGPRAFATAVDSRLPHEGAAGVAGVVAIALVVGFSEEVLYRGYLVTRLERLLGSSARGAVASALLFALAHVYQGAHGALSALAAALLYGAVFVAFRRVWPLAIAHVAWDAIWILAR